METVTLSDLGPIIAAVLGPMLLFVVASMRYQHVDSTKNRELIERSAKENRELIEQSRKENRELIEQSRKENRELIEQNRKLIERTGKELGRSLADTRERLARIEGSLGVSPPPRQGDGNSGADAEAA